MSNEQVLDKCVKQLGEFEQQFLKIFLERVKDKTPVDTGKLQAGWQGAVESGSIIVYNNVEYAEYVENGTENQAPVGMLATTLQEAPQIAQEAAQRVKK